MGVHEFKHQKKSSLSPEEVSHLPLLNHEDIEDIDDEKYDWVQIGREKFGRNMYCNNTKLLRTQTMGEFYGNTIVD